MTSGIILGLTTVANVLQTVLSPTDSCPIHGSEGLGEEDRSSALLAMVKCPKTIRTHCRKCKIHQEHKVSQYKKGKDRLVADGKRRYDRKMQGFGGQKKPIFHKKAKLSKKVTLHLTCTECKSIRQRCIGRAKVFTLEDD
eukprot:CAMPEP_0113693844 /NCGR_PEP_ID=MMETSP0038_2-20120614/19911_1 /TAXON_ID=2898 /ORGANISM="Cryptomonas paramecium" /LENGTH=139 /DNA_ID=CAMNT_0000616003 /DNA_START=396 /DNA_END=815 /DNA_ORIENTATION=+ /assembly_acc=CAM_ASM_000170